MLLVKASKIFLCTLKIKQQNNTKNFTTLISKNPKSAHTSSLFLMSNFEVINRGFPKYKAIESQTKAEIDAQ